MLSSIFSGYYAFQQLCFPVFQVKDLGQGQALVQLITWFFFFCVLYRHLKKKELLMLNLKRFSSMCLKNTLISIWNYVLTDLVSWLLFLFTTMSCTLRKLLEVLSVEQGNTWLGSVIGFSQKGGLLSGKAGKDAQIWTTSIPLFNPGCNKPIMSGDVRYILNFVKQSSH